MNRIPGAGEHKGGGTTASA